MFDPLTCAISEEVVARSSKSSNLECSEGELNCGLAIAWAKLVKARSLALTTVGFLDASLGKSS